MNNHMSMLRSVAETDVTKLEEAERSYGSSWKKRGGVGAFMMLARKWDRLENALRPADPTPARSAGFEDVVPWDIFGALASDPRAEGVIDDIRDLRRYLMLVEAEHLARLVDSSTAPVVTLHAVRDTESAAMGVHASRTSNQHWFDEMQKMGLVSNGGIATRVTPQEHSVISNYTLQHGSLAGYNAGKIYYPTPSGLEMVPEHQEEYGWER